MWWTKLIFLTCKGFVETKDIKSSQEKNMKMTWTDNLQTCENVQQHRYQFIAS